MPPGYTKHFNYGPPTDREDVRAVWSIWEETSQASHLLDVVDNTVTLICMVNIVLTSYCGHILKNMLMSLFKRCIWSTASKISFYTTHLILFLKFGFLFSYLFKKVIIFRFIVFFLKEFLFLRLQNFFFSLTWQSSLYFFP